jgi:hypothetical protein
MFQNFDAKLLKLIKYTLLILVGAAIYMANLNDWINIFVGVALFFSGAVYGHISRLIKEKEDE